MGFVPLLATGRPKDIGAALAEAGNVPAPEGRAMLLTVVALVQARKEGAQKAPTWRMARAQARRGQAAEALRWANALPTDYQQAHALLGVAEGLLARDQPQGRYRRTQVAPAGYYSMMEARWSD